jgi:hypothetical protein
MRTYMLRRTVLVQQYKEVEAADDAHPDDIIEDSWGIPWTDGKVIESEGIEIEHD